MSVSSEQTLILRGFETPLKDGSNLALSFSSTINYLTTSKQRRKPAIDARTPLKSFEGRYDFPLNLENDYPPYNHRRLHVRAMRKAPQSPDLIPLYHEDTPPTLALIFQSNDTSEKEETRHWNAKHDSTLSPGEHTLRLGELKIMIIGVIRLDFVDQMDLNDDDSYMTQTIDVNLEFWIQIVQPNI